MADVTLTTVCIQRLDEAGLPLDSCRYQYGWIVADDVESDSHFAYDTWEQLHADMNPARLLMVLGDRDTNLADTIADNGGLYWNDTWIPYATLYNALTPERRGDFFPPRPAKEALASSRRIPAH